MGAGGGGNAEGRRKNAQGRSRRRRSSGVVSKGGADGPEACPTMSGAVGQAFRPASSSGLQPRLGGRLSRRSGNLGQDAPKTGRLEARPTTPESALEGLT